MIQLVRKWLDRHFSDPQILIMIFALILGFILIYSFADMLAPVLIALVMAYLLEGMIAFLVEWRIPRLVAVMIVFLLFLTLLVFLLIWLLPLLSRQIAELVQQLPSMISSGQKEFMALPDRYPDFVSQDQVRQVMGFMASELTQVLQSLFTLSLASVRGLITVVIYFILVPLLIFFFLKDKFLIMNWLSLFIPKDRGLLTRVWNEVNQQITNYIRGKVWEIIIVWVVSSIVFSMLGLQFSMLMGLFVGLSVLIPYIGATFMTFPVALIAFFQWGMDHNFLYTVIAYLIIQALDGNLLAPLLLSEVVNLHPVAIIVALLVFGGLWGFWGLFFAIPLATLVHAVIKAWVAQMNEAKSKPAST